MKRKRVVLNNLEGRDFEQFGLPTKQLVWAVMSRPQPGTDEHILHLARNLRRSDFMVEKAHRLFNSESLVINWDLILWFMTEECLKPFNRRIKDHLLKTRQMVIEQIRLLKCKCPSDIDDLGIKNFHTMKHFRLSQADQEKLKWAASYYDLGMMAYPDGYWDQQKFFTLEERRELDFHARLIPVLKDFCNMPEDVAGLFVLHHYPSLQYPQNGIVARFSHLLANPKFRYMLNLLVANDMYAAGTSERPWRDKTWTHEEAVFEKLPKIMGNPDLVGCLPMIEAIKDRIPCSANPSRFYVH